MSVRRVAVAGLILLSAQAPAPAHPPAPVPPAPAATTTPPQAATATDVVARSGSVQLTGSDVRALVQGAAPNVQARLQQDPAALQQVVRSEILQKQLLAEALANKWDQSPAVQKQEQLARDAVVVNSYVGSLTAPPADFPPDTLVQSTYEANKAKFLVPRQFHMAQILVPVAADAPAATSEAAHKKLLALRALLIKPHADFAAAADKQAASKDGGDIGWLREDQLIPELKAAVVGLQEGGITQPLHTSDGWHMLKLLGTRPASVTPLADVRPTIVAALRQQQQQKNEQALVDKMQKQQPIEINEIGLARAVKP